MKNPKIILLPDGLYLIDAPEYPSLESLTCNSKCDGECGDVCPTIQSTRWSNESKEKGYTQALEQAIKEGVKFEQGNNWNYHALEALLFTTYGKLEQGKLYDIPINCLVKTGSKCLDTQAVEAGCWCSFRTDDGNEECKRCESYAVLEPLTKQEPERISLEESKQNIVSQLTEINEKIKAKLSSNAAHVIPENCNCFDKKECLEFGCQKPESTPVIEQREEQRKDFCLWYYAQSQPLDANKVFQWFQSQPESKQLTPTGYEFLLGKKIRYRYVDWPYGDYTIWATCTESDLRKFDDASIESIEFKP